MSVAIDIRILRKRKFGDMAKQEIMDELYNTCKNMTEEDFFKLEREANSPEEKSFYVAVSNFFLQLRQKEVIKQGKF